MYIQCHHSTYGPLLIDEATIKIRKDRYNDLKKRLENTEKLNVFREYFEHLWNSEAARLPKQLSKALVRAERSTAMPKSVRSSSTAASGSSQKSVLIKKSVALRDREFLKQELEDIEIPAEVSSELFSFYERYGEFAHQYVLEVFLSNGMVQITVSDEMEWEPTIAIFPAQL